jgi:hypothetical protein
MHSFTWREGHGDHCPLDLGALCNNVRPHNYLAMHPQAHMDKAPEVGEEPRIPQEMLKTSYAHHSLGADCEHMHLLGQRPHAFMSAAVHTLITGEGMRH